MLKESLLFITIFPMDIVVIAYYVIEEVADPQKVIKSHKKFLESIDYKGRI